MECVMRKAPKSFKGVLFCVLAVVVAFLAQVL